MPQRLSPAATENMLKVCSQSRETLRVLSLIVSKLLYVSDFLYIFVLFLTKAAVIAFLKRLATSNKHQKFLNMMTYGCVVACVVSMLIIGIRTDIPQPWKVDPSIGEAMVSSTIHCSIKR